MMSVERYRENLKWWEEREKQYPHHCKTKVGLSPEGVRHRMPGVDFIRVPFVKEAWWGFLNAEDLRQFKSLYVTLDNKA